MLLEFKSRITGFKRVFPFEVRFTLIVKPSPSSIVLLSDVMIKPVAILSTIILVMYDSDGECVAFPLYFA